MRHEGLGIANWLLIGVMLGGGMGWQTLRGEDRQEATVGRTFHVTSGRCVGLELTSLRQEAEQKAQHELSEQLVRLAEELSGRRLARRELARELGWLLLQPGVVQRVMDNREEKPLGLIVERTIELHLPQQVLAAWSVRLEQQQQDRQRGVVAGVGITLVGWLTGWGGLVVLDRLTGGYHRGVLGWTTLLVLGLGTAIGWAWVFWGL